MKIVDNPLSGVSTDEDDLGDSISETRIPLLRPTPKRHATPVTQHASVDVPDRCSTSSVAQFISSSNEPSSQNPKQGISPSGSSITSITAVNGKRSAGISQSQSLQGIIGNPQSKGITLNFVYCILLLLNKYISVTEKIIGES